MDAFHLARSAYERPSTYLPPLSLLLGSGCPLFSPSMVKPFRRQETVRRRHARTSPFPRAKPTHHRSSSYGGGTIPRIIVSAAPSLFFYIPKHRNYFIPPLLSLFLASIFQSLSGNLDCERAQFRFTTRPLLPTCYESVAFGYKRWRRMRDTVRIRVRSPR